MPEPPGLPARRRVLILAGTAEGRALAEALAADDRLAPIVSLAGLTDAEAPAGAALRRGGFGGAGGLAAYLRATATAAVIDATHPFAARISQHAAEAAAAAGVPLFRVRRRPWLPEPGDRWAVVDTLDTGLARLRALPVRRVFATLGRRALPRLAEEPTLHFLVRGIVPPPPAGIPPNVTWIPGKPPFPVPAEVALLRAHAVQALFAQASGGDLTRAKLHAARELRLPVVLLTPPPQGGAGTTSGSVADALAWLDRLLA